MRPSGSPIPEDARLTPSNHRLYAGRARYQRSWVGELVTQLRELDFVSWTTIFGAELLWSALPFIILLSSLANERIDDDLSRHIGLNSQRSQIIKGLFRTAPTHAVVPIATGLIFAAAGLLAVVGSLQVIYERVFELEHWGWRELPRLVLWVIVLLGALVAEAAVSGRVRAAAGVVVQAFVTFVAVTAFFAWTIHFLVAGRVGWRRVLEPAVVTAALWVALAFLSSAYFSSAVVSDRKLYGTIGVVFTLLTWFFLIGTVIVSRGSVRRGLVRAVQTGRTPSLDRALVVLAGLRRR